MPENSWTTLEYGDFTVVCPFSDISVHEIGSMVCNCTPRVELKQISYFKPVIVHSSFKEKAAIDKSIATIHE